MAVTWDDVRKIAMSHDGVEEVTSRGSLAWRTKKRQVAWERPLRKTDLRELGLDAQEGDVLGILVEDEGEKLALVEAEPRIFFTTSHFAGHRIVLARLAELDRARLAELVEVAYRIATE